MSKLTIFTPCYNRAYILTNLYNSLLNQTSTDFEWVIVDDGSSDNTEEIVKDWIKDNKINLRYFKQQNGGKHTAINRGVKEANGELFFIVDSDDYISYDAIENILNIYEKIKNDTGFAGISGICVKPNGMKVGGSFPNVPFIDASALDIRTKYHIRGDLAEVYKTEILRQYPFPVIEGERFLTEAMVWNRIALKYKLRYTAKPIYICDYLEDGLTANMTRLRHKNPKGAMLYYSEYHKMPVPFSQKIKGAINYWRFAFSAKDVSFRTKLNQIGLSGLPLLPIGIAMKWRDHY